MGLLRKLVTGLVKRLVSHRSPAPLGSHAPSILFLQYESPLGTAAIATATFAALRAQRPDARITVAAAGTSLNTLRASPLIDELIETPHAVSAFPAALAYFLRQVRPRRFDYVITDAGNKRGKISALALASGARNRIGFTLRPELFHRDLQADRSKSNIENNLQVLEALGLDGAAVEPVIHFTDDDLARMQELLGADVGAGPRIAMVTRTSKGHPNAWFDERWRELSLRLVKDLDAELIFVGAKGDRDDIDRLRSSIDRPTKSVAGLTDIPELAALITQCDLMITIDTGGLHVGRAVAAPSVVLAHAEQPANWWLPLNNPLFLILRKDYVPCALCFRFTCETRECMQEISVDEVLSNVVEQLKRNPPSAAARAARATARLSRSQPCVSEI